MKKILTILLAIMMVVTIHTSSIIAEGDNSGSSMENAINACVVEDGSESQLIRCDNDTYTSLLRDTNQNVNLYFVDNNNQIYSFVNLGRGNGQAIQMGGQIIYLKSEYLTGRKVMPEGKYQVYIEIRNWSENTVIWLKPGFTSEEGVTFNQLLNAAPSEDELAISSNGEGGLKIACVGAGDKTACNNYLNSLMNSIYTELNIFEYNEDDLWAGTKLTHINNGNSASSTRSIFTRIEGQLALDVSSAELTHSTSHSPNAGFENKDTNIYIYNAKGYASLIKRVNPLTITEPAGSRNNPITGCSISRDPNSTDANAFVVTCSGELDADIVLTSENDGSRNLIFVEKDANGKATGIEYSGMSLYDAIYSISEKALKFSNVILEASQIQSHNTINYDYSRDTYVPQGKYDILFNKTNSMGQGGSGVHYLLGTNVEVDQIKKPAPELVVNNDAENNILITCGTIDNACSEWLNALYDGITPKMRATSGGAAVGEARLDFIIPNTWGAADNVIFNQINNIGIIEKVITNDTLTALKIPANKLASCGFSNLEYEVKAVVHPYVGAEYKPFTPNVVIKDASGLIDKITITQEDTYPFKIEIKASDDESYEYLKSITQISGLLNSLEENYAFVGLGFHCDNDEDKVCTVYKAPYNMLTDEGVVTFNVVASGYTNETIEDFNIKLIHTQDPGLIKFVLASNGIQLYAENEEFLKMLTGQVEPKYPYSLSIYDIYTYTFMFGDVIFAEEELTGIFGTEIYENTISIPDTDDVNKTIELNKYVLINNPKLAEKEFNPNDIYNISIDLPDDYSYGWVSSDRYTGLTSDYFKGLSEDGYGDMTDEENLNILGVILGMDATDNNPNTIKKIYKEVHKKGNTADLGVDMPEVVGAIIERQNKGAGFSKENLEYMDANQVELGITFDNLDEADLEEGFKKFNVEKTDVGFEVTLTNRYFKDGDELEDEADNITELPKEVEMTFNLPSEDLEEGKEYMLLTIHNGNVKLLPIKVEKDANGNKVGKALVSEFSPFQVVVKETNTPTKPSTNGGYVVVNTGVK